MGLPNGFEFLRILKYCSLNYRGSTVFHDQSPRKNVADLGGGRTRDILVSSWTAHPTEPPRLTLRVTTSTLPCLELIFEFLQFSPVSYFTFSPMSLINVFRKRFFFFCYFQSLKSQEKKRKKKKKKTTQFDILYKTVMRRRIKCQRSQDSIACLYLTLPLKTLTKNFRIKIFSKSVTLNTRSLVWVGMVQHRTSDQYLTPGPSCSKHR